MKAVMLLRTNTLEGTAGERGQVLFLEDQLAHEAVMVHKLAVYRDEIPVPQAAPAPEPEPDPLFVGPERARQRMQELVQLTEDLGLYENQEVLPAGEDLSGFGQDPAAEPPRAAENKSVWEAWAVSQGCDPKEASMRTKNWLMSTYGERL